METKKRQAKKSSDAGFTLVEVIVIVAVIAIVAGVVAPMLFKQIDEAKVTRAEADCKSISSAVQAFRKDLGVWPDLISGGEGCSPGLGIIQGRGLRPESLDTQGYSLASILFVEDVLGSNDQGCYNPNKFKGPYLPRVEADPWGNAYVVNASNFSVDGQPVFVLSAGPDGVVETAANSVSAGGDDIYLRVK